MNQPIHHQDREISSSQDHCRCQACRNQQEFKTFLRPNPTNIYMYKHLKKRGVPPVKKELFNKELSHKAKYATKKQELDKKLQHEKTPATPTKHKLIQALRAKQTSGSSFFIDYHPVSLSQREKLPSKDGLSNPTEQPRRPLNIEDLRGGPSNKENRLRVGVTKLVQISENPQNIRLRYHNSRSVSQASASCNDEPLQISVKSLEKFKL